MRERIIWIILVLIGTGGGFYAGRMNGFQAGQAQVQQTASRFFAARGGGNSAGGGTGAARGGQQGNRRRNFQGQAVVGTVDSVQGNTITVKTANNGTTKIQLNADATIRKQVNGQISDIHQGDRVVATGTKTGDVFQAASVQLGGGFGGGGRAAPNQNNQNAQQ